MTQDSAILTAFAKALRARDRSTATVKHYLSDLRQFGHWFETRTGEPFTLQGVTEYDVRDWRDHLAATMKPATVNRKLAALAALYRWALEADQVQRDPTIHVNGVAQQPTAPKALSEQELTRILRKAQQGDNKRDIALLELLAATGLRASEVAGLKVGDAELNERSGWLTVRGKGRKQRRVPVNAKARRALREYLEERAAGEQGIAPSAEKPLFLTQKDTEMTPYAVWYTVKKYAQLAGAENVSPHTFRHTVATRLVREPTVDLVTAATFLGHSRLDTTARYSQPSEEDLAEAAERLG
jgi:site-specific recombinase XerD